MSIQGSSSTRAISSPESTDKLSQSRHTCLKTRVVAAGIFLTSGAILLAVGISELANTLSNSSLNIKANVVIPMPPTMPSIIQESVDMSADMGEITRPVALIVAGGSAALISTGMLIDMAWQKVWG